MRKKNAKTKAAIQMATAIIWIKKDPTYSQNCAKLGTSYRAVAHVRSGYAVFEESGSAGKAIVTTCLCNRYERGDYSPSAQRRQS